VNFVNNIHKAVKWFDDNSTDDYVYTSSKSHIPYHEVTGYFIPTLMKYGFKNKATTFADYLVSVQNVDGSWNPHGNYGEDRKSYMFDVAQILDGLSEFGEKYMPSINKALTWIENNIENNKFKEFYRHPDVKSHYCMRMLYCLKKSGYDINKLLPVYANDKSIYDFDVLSHFYAYAFEGCARLNMDCSPFINISKSYNGFIPERPNSSSYCYVALSQFALSLFLCGQKEMGMKNLEFVSRFQNSSGGFYGSNGNYFNDAEISWAVKYYLDAAIEAQRSWFSDNVHIFSPSFEDGDNDKRYTYIKNNILPSHKVLEVGCGKGRYINRLNCDRYACDVADASKYIDGKFFIGSCLQLPFEDNSFDIVFSCEVLEHSIFPDNAIKELLRVTKKGGTVLIIDKDKKIKFTELHFGEEWLDFGSIEKQYGAIITEINQASLAYPFFAAKIIKGQS
jgi:malonyl-CoA O-methyltransferase